MTEEVKPLVLLLYPEQQDQATVALGRAFIDAPVFKAIVPEIRDRS